MDANVLQLENAYTNTRDAITYSHGLQCKAIFKCTIANARPIIRYSKVRAPLGIVTFPLLFGVIAHPAIHIAIRWLHSSSKIHKFIFMMRHLSKEVLPTHTSIPRLFLDTKNTREALKTDFADILLPNLRSK